MNKYLFGVGTLLVLFLSFLMWNKARFREEKLMEMIETPTIHKGKTVDFCKYVIGSDPKEPDERYVKIKFVCGDRQAINTISWSTVKKPTVVGLIELVSKINGFDFEKVNFDCNIDGRKSVISDQLSVGNLVTCKIN